MLLGKPIQGQSWPLLKVYLDMDVFLSPTEKGHRIGVHNQPVSKRPPCNGPLRVQTHNIFSSILLYSNLSMWWGGWLMTCPRQPVASHYTHCAGLAHKALKIRYEHIRCTRFNNAQVAYAVHILNNGHEHADKKEHSWPKPSEKGCRMN